MTNKHILEDHLILRDECTVCSTPLKALISWTQKSKWFGTRTEQRVIETKEGYDHPKEQIIEIWCPNCCIKYRAAACGRTS